ncbi:MAG: thioredoxin [Nitrososphaerota archaeon]|nr:thioredoxin [Nitrososphaerota archaeon]
MRRGTSSAQGAPAKASGAPINLTDADFHNTVRNHPVMVVDFWAPWCGPCKVVSPILDELSAEMAGKVTFGKLNVDDNPNVAREFGIQGIPTVLIFKDGEAVDGLVGAAPKSMIEQRIKPHIAGGNGRLPYQ